MKGLMQSELFDVTEVQEKNLELKKKEHQKKNIEARKKLKIPYFEEPKNDNELLLNYQYRFIKNNDVTAWGQLIDLSFKVTKRLLWKWMKDKKICLDDIEQDEKTSIAVEYVLRRYEKNIGYAIHKSFISALNDGVKHAMLYTTELDKNTKSLDDMYFDENRGWRI